MRLGTARLLHHSRTPRTHLCSHAEPRVHTHTLTRTYMHAHIRTCAHVHTYAHAHIRTCTHTHMRTCTPTHMHTHAHAHMHACTHAQYSRFCMAPPTSKPSALPPPPPRHTSSRSRTRIPSPEPRTPLGASSSLMVLAGSPTGCTTVHPWPSWRPLPVHTLVPSSRACPPTTRCRPGGGRSTTWGQSRTCCSRVRHQDGMHVHVFTLRE